MFGAERRQLILELVRAHGAQSIGELAKAVNASEVTVRRDVATLQHRGLLERRHGGAMLPEHADADERLVLGASSTLPRTPMFGAERRRLICDLVRANKAVSIADLAVAVNASEMTVRRDLATLEKRGLIQRAHGGALLPPEVHDPARPPLPYDPADGRDPAPLTGEAMARLAASLVEDGDAIMLGAGPAVGAFAGLLADRRRLTVLTNSMQAAKALAAAPGVELVMTSGALDGESMAVVGSSAERWVADHRVPRAFVSGNGLTAERGLSSSNHAVSGVDRAMAASAGEVIVLAGRGAFNVDTTYQVVPVPRIAHLVTDGLADDPLVASLAGQGVRVHAPPAPRAAADG